MKYKKTGFLSFLMIVFISLGFSSVANGQESSKPQLYVHDIDFDSDSYEAGELVTGQFSLTNTANIAGSGISYRVQLVGNFDEFNYPQFLYTQTELQDNITIGPSEKKEISFSYQLPNPLPSRDLGIQIHTYIGTEIESARRAKPFAVIGEVLKYIRTESSIILDNDDTRVYSPIEGAPAFIGEGVSIMVGIENTADTTLTLTPKVEIHKGILTDPLTETFNGSSVTLNPGESIYHKTRIPLKENTLGVQTALVIYFDQNGAQRSTPMEHRYVVGGASVLLQSIGLSNTDLRGTKEFEVLFQFAEPPYKNRKDAEGNNFDKRLDGENMTKDMEAEVTISNTDGIVLDQSVAYFKYGENLGSVIFDTPYGISELVVKVELIREGKIIDEMERIIEVQTDEKSSIVAWLIGLLVLLLLILVVKFRHNKNDAEKTEEAGVISSSKSNLK